jgi:hypothetical protein
LAFSKAKASAVGAQVRAVPVFGYQIQMLILHSTSKWQRPESKAFTVTQIFVVTLSLRSSAVDL